MARIHESDFCKLHSKTTGKASQKVVFANKCCCSRVLQNGAAAVKASKLHNFSSTSFSEKCLRNFFWLFPSPTCWPAKPIIEIRTAFPRLLTKNKEKKTSHWGVSNLSTLFSSMWKVQHLHSKVALSWGWKTQKWGAPLFPRQWNKPSGFTKCSVWQVSFGSFLGSHLSALCHLLVGFQITLGHRGGDCREGNSQQDLCYLWWHQMKNN